MHAAVAGDGVYEPEDLRDKIATMLGNALPGIADGGWWYIAAGPPQALVFLHDVARPVLVPIGSAETFVRVGNEGTTREQDWAVTPRIAYSATKRNHDRP